MDPSGDGFCFTLLSLELLIVPVLLVCSSSLTLAAACLAGCGALNMRVLLSVLLPLLWGVAVVALDIISSVIGSGTSGNTGNGGQATSANIGSIYDVKVDSTNTYAYISDSTYNIVKRFSVSTGIIQAYAGTGTAGGSGNGGQATSATLWMPRGLAISTGSILYIAEAIYHRVRKVAANGIISTFAGQDSYASYGYSGDNGLATSAQLYSPTYMCFDSTQTYLYISDSGNYVIRRVRLSTNIITTFAGNGGISYCPSTFSYSFSQSATSLSLCAPMGLAIDSSSTYLYIVIYSSSMVIRVLISTSVASYFMGGIGSSSSTSWARTSVSLFFPMGAAIDSSSNLYVAGSSLL